MEDTKVAITGVATMVVVADTEVVTTSGKSIKVATISSVQGKVGSPLALRMATTHTKGLHQWT